MLLLYYTACRRNHYINEHIYNIKVLGPTHFYFVHIIFEFKLYTTCLQQYIILILIT